MWKPTFGFLDTFRKSTQLDPTVLWPATHRFDHIKMKDNGDKFNSRNGRMGAIISSQELLII